MKLLFRLVFILPPFASFAQTGKVDKNGAVQISFETSGGKTVVEITNHNQVRSRIDYKINGSLTKDTLDAGQRITILIHDQNFIIEAINHDTLPGSAEWLIVTSEILAEGIKGEKKVNIRPGKWQCGGVVNAMKL